MARSFFDAPAATDFLPFIKYDARGGHVFRVDRGDDGTSENVNITRSFKAVIDVENIELGWIEFNEAGVAPRFALAHNSLETLAKPEGKFKKGIRMRMKLSKECGGDIREFASNAVAVVNAVGALLSAYDEVAPANSGKVPVVTLGDPVTIVSNIKTDKGTMKATNYQPVFEIVNWVPRPVDLPAIEVVQQPKAAVPPASSAPPSTGATRSAPPVTKQVADEDDFG